MTMAIQRSGSNADTEHDLEQLENTLGATVPETYRGWLLDSGGGWVDELIVPGTDDNGILYRLMSPRDMLIQEQGLGFSKFVPKNYLVIGDGAGGGLAVGIKEEVRGRFYWADYDAAIDLDLQDTSSEQIMAKLAGSWPELLDVLRLSA